MAAAMHHVSMLPTIKCSSCGNEIEISMVGEHTCTDKQPSSISIEPIAPPPIAFALPKHSSPLYQVTLSDDDERSRSPSPERLEDTHSHASRPPAIDLAAAHNLQRPAEPPTPADSLTAPDISPSSTSSGERTSPFLEPPQSVSPPQLYTPRWATHSAPQSRPNSPEPLSDQVPDMPSLSPSKPLVQQRPRSPLSQTSYTPEPEPQASVEAPAPLRVSIPPPHTRQPSAGSFAAPPAERHRKSPSMEKNKQHSGHGPEEKKVLGLFRRKSSKSISKRDVSAPILGRNNTTPAVPGLPARPVLANLPLTPIAPGYDGAGKTLPTGPAPRRPARPESLNDLLEHMNTDGATPFSTSSVPSKSSTAPALPPPPRPLLPQLHEPRGRSPERSQQDRDSDGSMYTDVNPSPERPMQVPTGLPQISEEDGTPSCTAKDSNPPPSTRPEERLRASSESRHTPSESVSSNGSRFGLDKQSTSSMSSPPTSSASSFQFKDTLDESRTVPSAMPEPSSISPKIGTSPRAANFSRPRAPTLDSTTTSQGSHLSPPTTGAATLVESPLESPAPIDKQFDPPAPQPTPQHDEQPAPLHQPTLQAVSYQRHPPSNKPLPQPYVRPPLPPMPEEQALDLPPRPTLSRSRSTASKGQCRGCKHDITGKSVKAADGRLTGRWHKECFVCRTCRSPFQTADFYVLRDEPYCSHHYHVLNNSLCRHCHTGIEGRYFEIDGRRRFHTGCFACADCRRPLGGEYFEIGNRFYCEVDAERFHQRTHHLTGRRFPERRTTRLMEM